MRSVHLRFFTTLVFSNQQSRTTTKIRSQCFDEQAVAVAHAELAPFCIKPSNTHAYAHSARQTRPRCKRGARQKYQQKHLSAFLLHFHK